MNYDIKISNNYEGQGKLELGRVAFLSSHIKNIAQKALLLRLFGYSKVSLPTTKNVSKVPNIVEINYHQTGQITQTNSKGNGGSRISKMILGLASCAL